ncbi:hypothetical protein H5410_032405 [Solanum commersonii]|uniref:Uncharacterized protein n=1 Tax=Solanum commersonii TaxID=4109 RepID=A0A9J5YJV6_SOLCO|nr:hypothetical protein H5410_032405 [Solanum commersonii]
MEIEIVLRQLGFSIDIVWRLISNNWYSVSVNGQPPDLFKSSRRRRLPFTYITVKGSLFNEGDDRSGMTTVHVKW